MAIPKIAYIALVHEDDSLCTEAQLQKMREAEKEEENGRESDSNDSSYEEEKMDIDQPAPSRPASIKQEPMDIDQPAPYPQALKSMGSPDFRADVMAYRQATEGSMLGKYSTRPGHTTTNTIANWLPRAPLAPTKQAYVPSNLGQQPTSNVAHHVPVKQTSSPSNLGQQSQNLSVSRLAGREFTGTRMALG